MKMFRCLLFNGVHSLAVKAVTEHSKNLMLL